MSYESFPVEEYTRWFSAEQRPRRAGVYQLSRTDLTAGGSVYAWWNGEDWEPFENWGHYHHLPNMIWRGLVRKHRHWPEQSPL